MRLGAELGASAIQMLVSLFRWSSRSGLFTILSVLDTLQTSQLRFIEDAKWLSYWCRDGSHAVRGGSQVVQADCFVVRALQDIVWAVSQEGALPILLIQQMSKG